MTWIPECAPSDLLKWAGLGLGGVTARREQGPKPREWVEGGGGREDGRFRERATPRLYGIVLLKGENGVGGGLLAFSGMQSPHICVNGRCQECHTPVHMQLSS